MKIKPSLLRETLSSASREETLYFVLSLILFGIWLVFGLELIGFGIWVGVGVWLLTHRKQN